MILEQNRKGNLSIYGKRPFRDKCNTYSIVNFLYLLSLLQLADHNFILPGGFSLRKLFSFLSFFGLAGRVPLHLQVNKIKMLCRTAEHLVYAVMPPKPIPVPDRVLYNNNMADKITQGNHMLVRPMGLWSPL